MSFQNSYLLLLVSLLAVVEINPYSFLNFNFILNTSWFTFYITLCISIYDYMHGYNIIEAQILLPEVPYANLVAMSA